MFRRKKVENIKAPVENWCAMITLCRREFGITSQVIEGFATQKSATTWCNVTRDHYITTNSNWIVYWHVFKK